MNAKLSSVIAQSELFPNSKMFDKATKEQLRILKYCIDKGIPLSNRLAELGMTYDDLRYAINKKFQVRGSRYYRLEEFAQKSNGVPVVSFFAGAGGLDLGLEAAGFDHALLIEKNPLFCETIKRNRPDWDVQPGDVSNKEEMIDLISKRIGRRKTFDGVFVGGPPCQPFSIAANQRFSKNGDNFKRTGFSHETNGNLLFDYIDLITHFRPRAFLIENVPGLIDVDGGEQLERAYELLEKSGYRVHQPAILKADSYYVPQQRVRLFIVGSRKGKEFSPPIPSSRSLAVSSVFKISMKNIENHITREHSAESILRYMMLDYGSRDKLGRVDRLDPSHPSKTVIAGGSAGGGRSHLHPYIPRTLSVRESARIQTFPDDYVFLGPVARQFTQVGNAVPPVLGAQLGQAIHNSLL